MTSTFTTNKNIEKPAYNDYASNPTGWSGPINTDWDIIDRSFGGTQVKNPTGISGTVVLTASEYQAAIFIIGTSITGTATLTANVTYQIPSGVGGIWTVYNNTTGAFTVTISSAGGGSSLVAAQGLHTLIYSDGTNILRAENSGAAPGSNGQVVYNSSGVLAASSSMTWNGTTFSASNISTGGTLASGGNITSGGSITATGNVTAYSDRNLKKDILTICDALEKVKALRGVNFTMINTGAELIGVIAQEVQEVVPEVVQDNNGVLSVAYGNLTALLIEAVKELSDRLDAVEGGVMKK